MQPLLAKSVTSSTLEYATSKTCQEHLRLRNINLLPSLTMFAFPTIFRHQYIAVDNDISSSPQEDHLSVTAKKEYIFIAGLEQDRSALLRTYRRHIYVVGFVTSLLLSFITGYLLGQTTSTQHPDPRYPNRLSPSLPILDARSRLSLTLTLLPKQSPSEKKPSPSTPPTQTSPPHSAHQPGPSYNLPAKASCNSPHPPQLPVTSPT
jgi:hypothetical protein